MNARKVTPKICIYCGEAAPRTKDHIPPKNLYDKPYPSNLLTVPACRKCNGAFSKDDEYFRVALTITEKAKGQPNRDAVVQSVMRGINKPESGRFRASLLANSDVLPRFTESGLYVNHQRAMAFDGQRLDRVAKRIVKGLFYKVKEHRLPDDHGVNALAVGRIRQLVAPGSEVDLTFQGFIALIEQETLTSFGGTFGFRWLQSPNGTEHTMWLLYFYGHLEYFCSTFALSSTGTSGDSSPG
jgi:hypothetical protein